MSNNDETARSSGLAVRVLGSRTTSSTEDADDVVEGILEDGPLPGNPPPVASTTRAIVQLTTRHHEVVTQVIAELAVRDKYLYTRSNRLVRLIDGAEIEPLAPPNLTDRMTRYIALEQVNSKGMVSNAHPPSWLVGEILDRKGYPGFRPLRGFTRCPTLRPDGTILDEPGYDAQSGLMYTPDRKYPKVDHLGLAEARAAAERVLDLVKDFPFASEVDRIRWLALPLTLVSRLVCKGALPIFLAEANIPGAGKDLAVRTAVGIVEPQVSVSSLPDNEAEIEKRINTIAMGGYSHQIWSNLKGTFGGPSIEAACTMRSWRARVLGQTQGPLWQWDAILCGSGNGVVLTPDMVRRTIRMELDFRGDAEALQKREFDRNLDQWVPEHRPHLLHDVLTIMASFLRDGSPNKACKMSGFEGWAAMVPSALTWMGYPNILEGHGSAPIGSDQDTQALLGLLEAWPTDATTSLPVAHTSAELLAQASGSVELTNALKMFAPGRGGDLPTPKGLGKALTHVRGRPVGVRRINGKKDRKGIEQWTVETIQPANPAPAGPPAFDDLAQYENRGSDEPIFMRCYSTHAGVTADGGATRVLIFMSCIESKGRDGVLREGPPQPWSVVHVIQDVGPGVLDFVDELRRYGFAGGESVWQNEGEPFQYLLPWLEYHVIVYPRQMAEWNVYCVYYMQDANGVRREWREI